jgi:hypothetical protein
MDRVLLALSKIATRSAFMIGLQVRSVGVAGVVSSSTSPVAIGNYYGAGIHVSETALAFWTLGPLASANA